MIRKLIAKYFGYPIQNFRKKTRIPITQKFLQESQYWNEAQMYNYRLSKLQQLVRFSYKHVPYYTELFDRYNISPDLIKKLDDIKRIPILTKELARLNHNKLVSDTANFKYIHKGKTGGTTGVPLLVYSDAENRSFSWASFFRWYNWIGIEKEDRVLTLWGAHTVLKSSVRDKIVENVIDWIQNKKTINTFNIHDETLPGIYNQMIKYNPVLIKGYLSALILIAKYMQQNNLPPNKSLIALSSTTETLLPMYRNLLQEVFKVPVYDQYGCGEITSIAFECSKHQGLHINEEHVYIESLDEKDSEIINDKARLIVTSLDNYVMPFIRYEIGDMATIQSEKCTCGINSLIMKTIDGRTMDLISLKNGSKVNGLFFTRLLGDVEISTDMISRFQIYQYKSGAIDFILETKNIIPENLLHKLEYETLRFINTVKIILVDYIPNEPTGKFKYIKSESNYTKNGINFRKIITLEKWEIMNNY